MVAVVGAEEGPFPPEAGPRLSADDWPAAAAPRAATAREAAATDVGQSRPCRHGHFRLPNRHGRHHPRDHL